MKNLILLGLILSHLMQNLGLASSLEATSCRTIFDPPSEVRLETLDGVSGWGIKLLPKSVFKDNKWYQENLAGLMNSNSTRITPYYFVKGHGLRGPYDDLLFRWTSHIRSTITGKDLRYIKNGVRYQMDLLELKNTGTDANNALYEHAAFAYKKRTGKVAKRPQLLFFADPEKGLFPYGGTFGRTSEISIRFTSRPQEILDHYTIKSPQTKFYGNIPKTELKRLKKIEDEALVFIRKQVLDESLEIGGIFLEPVSVSHGIHFYRPEFLQELRKLADELHIPIMADEIFTGGGRTGKFWAFQHYQDFFPDLVTFGKGLELSGIAQIKRYVLNDENYIWNFPSFDPSQNRDMKKWSSENDIRLDNTSIASAFDALRAFLVIETVTKTNLIEQVEQNGKDTLDMLRHQAVKLGIDPKEIQGIGMIFHFGPHIQRFFSPRSVQNYEGRVTPLLTTRPSDWPAFLGETQP